MVKGAVEQVVTLSEGNSAALQQMAAGIPEVSAGAARSEDMAAGVDQGRRAPSM